MAKVQRLVRARAYFAPNSFSTRRVGRVKSYGQITHDRRNTFACALTQKNSQENQGLNSAFDISYKNQALAENQTEQLPFDNSEQNQSVAENQELTLALDIPEQNQGLTEKTDFEERSSTAA